MSWRALGVASSIVGLLCGIWLIACYKSSMLNPVSGAILIGASGWQFWNQRRLRL